MTTWVHELIRRHAEPLLPQETALEPRLRAFTGLRAVLFDVYGTMVVSGCGDVGTIAAEGRVQAAAAALGELGLSPQVAAQLVDHQQQVIAEHHARLREQGIDTPEVDILGVWRDALTRLPSAKASHEWTQKQLTRFAVEFEVRVNPMWPMPGLAECLAALKQSPLHMGIVSNAQFFTPELFPALLGQTLEELGFAANLCFYSYERLIAKPGTAMFRAAAEQLAAMGIEPAKVLYVGNDLLNDIKPAAEVGFATALFAGDKRSLRTREGDDRVIGVVPDLVITHLAQLADVVLA